MNVRNLPATRLDQRILPQEEAFRVMKLWRGVAKYLLYAISVVSVLSPVLNEWGKASELVGQILRFFNYLLIVFYYVVSVVTEIFLFPSAARQRRMSLIDNSFGARFVGKDSRHYFSNDTIPNGAYKLCVNCFENCFFTYNIARRMIASVVAKNAIFGGAFIVLAYWGIANNEFTLPILQAFLSSLFLTNLIHHLNFTAKLGNLLERFRQFFMDVANQPSDKNAMHYCVALFMEYETTLAYNKAPLSDKVYNQFKMQLTAEWSELKTYYRIE